MSQHVFISYLRENKNEVRKLVDNLQAAGIEVCIEGGEIGWDEVRRAIKESMRSSCVYQKKPSRKEGRASGANYRRLPKFISTSDRAKHSLFRFDCRNAKFRRFPLTPRASFPRFST
jgi:hypothetical protein